MQCFAESGLGIGLCGFWVLYRMGRDCQFWGLTWWLLFGCVPECWVWVWGLGLGFGVWVRVWVLMGVKGREHRGDVCSAGYAFRTEGGGRGVGGGRRRQ